MECMYCQGSMERKTAPFSIDRDGYHIHWHALPAWVCTQCGEAYFDEQEVDRIQKVLQSIDLEMDTSSKVA